VPIIGFVTRNIFSKFQHEIEAPNQRGFL